MSRVRLFAPALVLAATLPAAPAIAGPADYVYTPTVEEGERELDFKFGSAHADGREDAASLGLGWGAQSWWFTELYLKWGRDPGTGGRIEAYEWENRFQLTETGQYAVDVGLVTELEIPRDGDDPREWKVGLLLQRETGKWQFNGNLLLEREFGGVRAPGEARPTELGYQWQVKYRATPVLELGLQGLGDVGPWNDWEPGDEQPHSVGPAFFGKVPLGSGTGRHAKLAYNGAVLFGLTDGAPDHTLRLQVELEF
jgi:hypothetical protein